MANTNQTLDEFLTLVNKYPSPHNGQPIVMRKLGNTDFELLFEKTRGLQSSDISYIFSFVTMGVFIEHAKQCANAQGHAITFVLDLPKVEKLSGEGKIPFATCSIRWNVSSSDLELEEVIRKRQTSRKKYHGCVTPEFALKISDIAAKSGMQLVQLSPANGKQAIWLNQRAVFDDMFDEPVRRELDHWLRYDKVQKHSTKDGLSYDCMELSGKLLKFIVRHPKVLRLPGLSWALKKYYLSNMNDNSSVFYMLAPFKTERNSFDVGQVIMQIWFACAKEDYYIHPFGTIVSNTAAHRDFMVMAGVNNESLEASYLTFIFRAGRSDPPVSSLRLDINEHLLQE